MSSSTITPVRPSAAARPTPGLRWRGAAWSALALFALFAIVVAAAPLIEAPLRRRLERELNAHLTGYTATLPELDLRLRSFGLSLRGLTIRQNAHPEPPVIVMRALDAGVHWRALLSLRLVADFTLESPRLHIDRRQLAAEADDSVDVEDKGWQQALESIYPLKINQFVITDGALTYVDDDRDHPLELTRVELLATNIRNIRAPKDTYPSPIQASAVLFDRGRVRLAGQANFLAEPHPAVRTEVELTDVPLQRLRPVAVDANLHVSGGILSALGKIEYTPARRAAHLVRARIDDLAVDYVHSPQTAAAESERLTKASAAAANLASQPDVAVQIDELHLANAALGYVDQTTTPPYRIFITTADVRLEDLSNRSDAERGRATVTGRFMGSGSTQLSATFAPRRADPAIGLKLQIEGTSMRSMNDLFRAYGDFDVVAGTFAFYSELHIEHGAIDGYVKPLFTDMQVYDRRQDSQKALFQQLYEGMVGGIAVLLENRRDDVATHASVSGRVTRPELSTWEVVVNLIRNAFFRSILPGFDRAVREANAPQQP